MEMSKDATLKVVRRIKDALHKTATHDQIIMIAELLNVKTTIVENSPLPERTNTSRTG